MPLIYVISGEASGDALGAGLMRELKAMYPDVTFAGVGGEQMRQEGMQSVFPGEKLAVMGFWEIVPHIPQFLRLLKKTAEDIAQQQPDAVITIDSPGFNFRLAAMLKNDGRTRHIKRIHYVAPSVWAYKPQRAKKTAALFDGLLALLPFEPPLFEKEGLKTVFVGHPVLWGKGQGDASGFRARHGIKDSEKLLLVLPGSRMGEVKRHLLVFLKAARCMEGYKTVVLAGQQVREYIAGHTPQDITICDFSEKYDAFAATSMALSKSGTVTLELAAAGVPMIVAYKVSPLSAWLIRRMLQVKYASLVNIAVDNAIVPEYMQEKCTATALAQGLRQLEQPAVREQQLSEVARSLTVLRGHETHTPSRIAATAVAELMGLKTF